jgi:zinc protease
MSCLRFVPAVALAVLLPLSTTSAAAPPPLEIESYALPNGLTVTLQPDHRVPRVVVNTLFGVGSRDEVRGRTGFAHLFEHLMFMGTRRVPGNQFDVLMESSGGANNAMTSEDWTTYFSWGPASILPTLLWLDADRFDALGATMTQAKLDLQREVVRNERRQTSENRPYGASELVIGEAMYPQGHPYHHPVIGSHQDLEAARLEDVVGFFDAHYVPANASLVVVGDFAPEQVRRLVEQLMGPLAARPLAGSPPVAPARLDGEVRRLLVDRVELPRIDLIWHATPAWSTGAAELQLLARILGEGPSSRLWRRLVIEQRLAASVDVSLEERRLGSLFRIQVTGLPGADLDAVKREVLSVLAEVSGAGPSAAELARARARQEVQIRQAREDLVSRALKLNEYRSFLGKPDGFAVDLDRFAAVSTAGVRDVARGLGPGRLDLRVIPRGGPAGSIPDARPADLPAARVVPPVPVTFRLASGVEVRAAPLPGSGLLAGEVVFPSADRTVPADKAGATALLARLLTAGAGGRDAAAFAAAASSLGAQIEGGAERGALGLKLHGLSRHLAATLDLVADAVLRPTLARADFEREQALLQAQVEARSSDPLRVASLVSLSRLFGPGDPRARPTDGYAATVASLTLGDLRALASAILDPRAATIVLAGDFDPMALRLDLERRFGAWASPDRPPPPAAPPLAAAVDLRLVLVDRPGAPQTTVLAARPLATVDGPGRAARTLASVALGGSFTSRLNQNLRERHGYTYGADTRLSERDGQTVLAVSTAVQTEVTGAALGEIRKELDGLTAGGLPAGEASKARETARSTIAERLMTAASVSAALSEQVLARRPPGSLADDVQALDQADPAAIAAAATGGAFGFGGLSVVLVGDAAAVMPQLEKAGFPAPLRLDVEGRPAGSK